MLPSSLQGPCGHAFTIREQQQECTKQHLAIRLGREAEERSGRPCVWRWDLYAQARQQIPELSLPFTAHCPQPDKVRVAPRQISSAPGASASPVATDWRRNESCCPLCVLHGLWQLC
eukprot:4334503-Amphidinium_carterae.1